MKSNIKKVASCCNNCGVDDSEVVTQGKEQEYADTTDDSFTVVACKRCGLIYLNPRPDESELSTIYPRTYFAYNTGEKYDQVHANNPYWRLRRKITLTSLQKGLSHFFQKGSTVKVLDVGCGDGYMLDCFKQIKTHRVETSGVEMDEQAAQTAHNRGHNIYTGRFEEVLLPANHFDIVFASHIIEHVPDPKLFARKAWDTLRPGGVFSFVTPNTDGVDARLFMRKHWGGYHFPRHWYLYNPNTARILAAQTGFEVVGIAYYPMSAHWILSLRSMMKSNAALSGLADIVFPADQWYRLTPLNFLRNALFTVFDYAVLTLTGRTSCMGVALRKPDGQLGRTDTLAG